MTDGRLLQVNVSDGGVPKLPVEDARITTYGVEGDRQASETVHGGPHRAVAILGIEAIRRVAAEGHPIGPGTTGENLTTEGFDVSALPVGTRLAIGDDVVLEISQPTNPCRTIRHSFADLRFGRLSMKAHPADSRMYARVIAEGVVRTGDPIRLEAPTGAAAETFQIADRLDHAERESALAFWAAATAAGHTLDVLDDGDIAACASATLPGPVFNSALGFAHLPNLVERAVAHFQENGVTGWVLADDPPWPDAIVDSTLARYAIAAPDGATETDGVRIRELPRTEVGPWADVIVAASDLPPSVAAAWRDLEPELALVAHHHRFVAEVDGRPVGAGSLHLHHQLGWLRAGSVLASHRGRGIQRALITHRAAHARRLGADLVGASALEGSASAANLERLGFRRIGTRRSYRAVPTA
ncbi:MAG TPA: GNAT family N-acetyltransferase [Candidatus Limnocylindrales bacterium]|nr:GNAT family N-acetyltransferase [Candidatus Limnocylindrales bacterium]